MKRFLAALAVAAVTGVHAQGYPERPIHFIVPFTAGSGTDIVARTLGEAMSKGLGQPIVVENRPGAGGTLGAGVVAKSAPDGYTLLVHSAGHAANPAIYTSLPYDTVKDFACVTPLASLPNVLVVPPQRGWKTVKDLVDAAQAKPGSLNYGSAGVGSATHMNAEIFRQAARFDAVHIPYKGTPEAMTETATGRIDFFFAPLASALQLVKGGRLQALAVGTGTRSPVLPDVPTTVEAGYPHSEYVFWVALLAPTATPHAVVERLNAEALKALASPAVKQRLEALGAEPMPMGPEACDTFIRAEVVRMAAVVKSAGLKAQ
ncbi:MAG TPA: tripartite tricarboxylate transporter substrate binding protein [Usitatibacter sp.]|nr:tripartite tricarboxylate transporter substrate binding protein [Usitatibacter sp.]